MESKHGSIEVRTMLKTAKKPSAYFTVDSSLFSSELTNSLATLQKLLSFEGKTKAARWKNKHEVELFTSTGELVRYNTRSGETGIVSLKVPKQPIDIQSIFFGPHKRVWLSGYLAGGNAAYTPATGETVEYAGLIQSEGMAKQGQHLYFGIYPHAQLYRYDTHGLWDQSKGNPRLIQQVAGQSRPFAMLSVDTLQKVFFGTVPNYGVLGGAITEYNRATGETATYTEIVSRQSPVCLTYVNGIVWGGTSISGDLGSPK